MGRWQSVFASLACLAGALLCVGSAAPRPNAGDPPLPTWIREISPHGSVDTLAQIRVLFTDPVIPLEAVESPDRQTKLRFFHVQPALPGHFIFLTPRMVGFQMDRALPLATRITVTVDRGLSDLNGHALTSDVSWSFQTTPIDIGGLPHGPGSGLYPNITLESNTQLDIDSLRARTALRGPAGAVVPILIQFEKDRPVWDSWPGTLFDPSLRMWTYSVKVLQALSTSTAYTFTIAPGVRPTGGNMASSVAFKDDFRTYDPLRFDGLLVQNPTPPPVPPLGNRYGNLSLELGFNNSLAPGSALKHITISPRPDGTTPWLYEGGMTAQINPDALDPRTTYTFTIDADLTDVFGQTLGSAPTATYTTGDLYPDFWANSSRAIFAPSLGFRLNLIARNLPGDAYQAAFHSLSPDEMFSQAREVLPDRKTWPDFRVHGLTNAKSDLTLSLSKLLGRPFGAVAYGLAAHIPGYEDDNTWAGYGRAIPAYGIAEVTDLGIYFQETPHDGVVRVQRLSDGSDVEGASIDVYPAGSTENRNRSMSACASAKTDGLGLAILSGAGWARCLEQGTRTWGAPILMVVAKSGDDWTFTRTDEDRSTFSGWETGPSSRGTLFSDRGLYQPGETAQFTGIAYYEQDGTIHRDANAVYTLTMVLPDGSPSPLGTVTADAYGTFSKSVRFKASQTVGSYRISAVNRAHLELDCSFTIAQFTPPNFEVHLTVSKDLAFAGDSVGLTSTSKYLFGVPVSNAKTSFHASGSQTTYDPPGWDGFSFGPNRWWFEPSPQYAPPELTATSAVDAHGRATQSVSVPGNLPYPIRYGVDATTTDVSNRSVADTASFVALPGDAFIGVKSPWLADAGKPISIQTIVVDHLGKTLRGRGVTATLQRLDYGTAEDEWHPHFTTVDTATTTSGDAPVPLSLTPPAAGTYRIRANFAGSSGDSTATDAFVWAAGPGQVDWGNQDTGLTIHLDKKTYHVGDTATAMIESHFVPGDLYFSIVKNRLLYHTVVKVTQSAPEIRFTVTPDMLPNSEVEAVLVRQGVTLSRSNAKSRSDVIRFGAAQLFQNLDDRYLKIAVSPRSPSVEPGKRQTLDITVSDVHGKPVRAQLAVMVVNDDILQLNGYRPPDLVASVYDLHPVSSLIADNRSAMLFAQPTEPPYQYAQPMAEGSRFTTSDVYSVSSKVLGHVTARAAKDGSSPNPNVTVRTNFQQMAYYDLAVQTGPDGKAKVTFTTPDDLTRWRVFAEASGAVTSADDRDYRFGYGESTFIDTKALLTNPLLPQFARPGDVFDGGLSVTSGIGAAGMLSIKGALVGPISFGSGHAANSLDVAMRTGTQAFRFPITVSKVAPATIQFTTLLGGESDAFRVPLALTPLEITEQVIDSGATTTGARIPLRVDPKVDDRAGGLQLSIASTLLPQITVPAEQMLAEPCLPFLTEAAAQLSAAADMQIIADRYGQRFPDLDLHAIATRNLDVYEKLQRSDSGFADWPGSTWQDAYANAYAAEALARAKRAGFAVPPSFIDSSKSILRAVENDPRAFAPLCDEACRESIRLHALIGLAALGETRTQHLPAVYAQRDSFGYVDRLLLARYLSAIPAWKTQADALAVKLAETIYETGRYATVNSNDTWWWWWSGTESQAQAIRLYSSRPASADFRDRLVRGLLAQRRKGAWSNTFDTAEALDALVDYLALESRPPNFEATAAVGGRTVMAAHFEGYRQPLRETTIGMPSLPRGLSNVDLRKTGTGTLHYVIAYRYRLQGAQPGAMEGIRIDRLVHPVDQRSVLATIGVATRRNPLTLPPGQVYDVELVIVADHPLDQVVITDPLPAGMEAVDSSFKTATPYFQPLTSAWNIDYTQIYRDRVVAFANRLGAGVYSFHYLARTVTPGTFLWPGADAHLEFAPEQFGRTTSSTLKVSN